jgi:Fe-S-cluster containining protein
VNMDARPRPVGMLSMTELATEANQSLCLVCGLCCDGTLFDRVVLRPEDDAQALTSRGIQISATTPPAFRQRCVAYRDRSCNIYVDRPHACRQFRCVLLRQLEAEKISQTDALKIVREAATLRNELREGMRAVFGDGDGTLDQFGARLKTGWNDAPSAEAKHRVFKLFEKFAALWLCVNKHFRKQRQR